jgi:diguanylate cyclase (GGDEF)-like protein
MTSFTRWFAPPVFEGDEEKTRRARLIHVITTGFLAFALVIFCANVLGGRAPATTIRINLIAIVLLLPVKPWLRRGKLSLAQGWLLFIAFVCVTAGVASLGTIRAPVAAIYLPGVVMAGLLFDRKGIFYATGACSAAVLGLILAENGGLLPKPDYAVGIAQWITYTALCGFTGGLAFSINRITKDALSRAEKELAQRKQTEEALSIANQKLSIRVQEVEILHEAMRVQAHHDGLTGLYNRRYLVDALERETARAKRSGNPLSFVLLDIDHFKDVNDRYGHPAGDEVLVQLARLLTSNARGSDIICRYGGEEFLLVLPDTSLDLAVKFADVLRSKCEAFGFKAADSAIHITLSFGVATLPDHGSAWEEVVARSDVALYQSKGNGRNRVTAWQKTG